MFEIEKGVPLTQAPPKGIAPEFPFSEMAVGDSFFVPHDYITRTHTKPVYRALLQNRAATPGNRKYGKFKVRKVEGGFRVWKVEDA